MKIGLIDVDSHNYPNLCLMKLSAYHKQIGDNVEWYDAFEHYDLVYVSKVFSNTYTPDYNYVINADKVVRGGTGYCIDLVDGREVFHEERNTPLPYEIEHIMPDYSIYPQFAGTAYGFLTRGCPRGCQFCIVGKKEGLKSVKVADLSEFWNGQKKIVLNDPNILACAEWEDLLGQCSETKSLVYFNQGFDIRLMTEQKAKALRQIQLKEIHFAWDKYNDREKVLRGLQMFKDVYGVKHLNKGKAIYVYTIVNFDTTFEQDLERIYALRELQFNPFIMIYNKPKADRRYYRLQRWCNNPFVFWQCDKFEDYHN